MPINVGGSFTIGGVSGSDAFKIAGSTDILKLDTTGRMFQPNQIGFIAASPNDPGWQALTSGAWTKMSNMSAIAYNVGGGYNASNSRFTAPVTGTYLIHSTCYCYKPGIGAGAYMHAMHWINGAQTINYKARGWFQPTSYSYDADFAELLYLNAGDYVDIYFYAGGAGFSYYQAYQAWEGVLVG